MLGISFSPKMRPTTFSKVHIRASSSNVYMYIYIYFFSEWCSHCWWRSPKYEPVLGKKFILLEGVELLTRQLMFRCLRNDGERHRDPDSSIFHSPNAVYLLNHMRPREAGKESNGPGNRNRALIFS